MPNASSKHSGWKQYPGNTYISAYHNGTEGIRLTKSVTGCDIRLLGDTPATNYIEFDASTYKISFYGSAKLGFGVSGTELSYTAGTPIFTLYATNAGTSGATSAEPFYVYSALTGAGQVGGRSRFHTYSNVASGGWVNALKAYMEFGASGSASGLASGICSEVVLSAGTSSGTYTCFEGEMVLGSGASTGTSSSFMYFNVSGAAATTWDSNGFLFELGTGFTSGSGKFWYDNTANAADEFIKVKTESGTRYLILSDDTSFA